MIFNVFICVKLDNAEEFEKPFCLHRYREALSMIHEVLERAGMLLKVICYWHYYTTL